MDNKVDFAVNLIKIIEDSRNNALKKLTKNLFACIGKSGNI